MINTLEFDKYYSKLQDSFVKSHNLCSKKITPNLYRRIKSTAMSLKHSPKKICGHSELECTCDKQSTSVSKKGVVELPPESKTRGKKASFSLQSKTGQNLTDPLPTTSKDESVQIGAQSEVDASLRVSSSPILNLNQYIDPIQQDELPSEVPQKSQTNSSTIENIYSQMMQDIETGKNTMQEEQSNYTPSLVDNRQDFQLDPLVSTQSTEEILESIISKLLIKYIPVIIDGVVQKLESSDKWSKQITEMEDILTQTSAQVNSYVEEVLIVKNQIKNVSLGITRMCDSVKGVHELVQKNMIKPNCNCGALDYPEVTPTQEQHKASSAMSDNASIPDKQDYQQKKEKLTILYSRLINENPEIDDMTGALLKLVTFADLGYDDLIKEIAKYEKTIPTNLKEGIKHVKNMRFSNAYTYLNAWLHQKIKSINRIDDEEDIPIKPTRTTVRRDYSSDEEDVPKGPIFTSSKNVQGTKLGRSFKK